MNETDHDLLISMKAEFGTKLDRVITDVKELKENVADRVTALELEKSNKSDVEKAFVLANGVQTDHESRLRTIETAKENWTGKYAILAIIGMFLLGIFGSLISKLFIK